MSHKSDLREIYLVSKASSKSNQFPDNNVVSSRYTILTFLPKNLFEQFRRMINFFFLCLIIIQVSIDIPVNPIPYIAAFVFVIGVTGLKQGYEDWCRHKADNKVNFARVHLVNDHGATIEIKSKDIKVGQIIKLEENEAVPADLVLVGCLSSSGVPQSYCQITTTNLDGETNLKMRFCPPDLDSIFEGQSLNVNKLMDFLLKCDQPNSDLYKFNGQITAPKLERPILITMENVLLRGSRIKSGGSVYGVSIYTGKDTRLSMNSNASKTSKFSTVEHTMNKIVLGMFGILLILSSASVGFCFMYQSSTFDGVWYLPQSDASKFKVGVTTFFSYLVLLCYLIPVSLSVTFELQKLGCSKFFSWDNDMVCPVTGTRPLCNTSDLNEELGQVEYLFTDKTGTLTDNDLIFRCCSVNGVQYKYSELDGKLSHEILEEGSISQNVTPNAYSADVVQFLEALAVCHTVRVLPNNNNSKDNTDLTTLSEELHYQSNSLDEEVLVKAAHKMGMKFLGENENIITIEDFGKKRKMKRLATLEFDSDRKCMSVIMESDATGQLHIFCKGAESSIFPKCINSQALMQSTEKDVTDFAKMGFRTLVVAHKMLDKDIINNFLSHAEKVRNNPDELQKLYIELESDLTILGCTGVEDRLQDGVQQTLSSLKEAGIRILMLTGDKLETALSVASSCGLISPKESRSNDLHVLSFNPHSTDSDDIVKKMEIIKSNIKLGSSLYLVVDGQSFAIGIDKCKDLMRFIISKANAVIFCRMAPLQKAQVVNLIKNYPKKMYKTCAVGDGGNDCAMLREAHLGIGIMGKEGLQAARESDFAIARFRFLQIAILVHGYWYYHRLATLITYFFYRGIVFIAQIFLYGFDSGFTAQTIFHSTFVMMFTISFTSLPVLIQGLTEQPIPREELLNNPAHYKNLNKNKLMNFRNCFRWIAVGFWHIAICYYVPRFTWAEGLSIDDHGAFSLYISSIIVVITDTKILVETRYFTWLTLLAQLFSYITMLAFYYIICHAGSNPGGILAFSYFPLLNQVELYLTVFLVAILCVLPDLLLLGVQNLRMSNASKANNDLELNSM